VRPIFPSLHSAPLERRRYLQLVMGDDFLGRITCMIGYSCQARQAVISALDKLGWCYGKAGQIGADMRWHKCTRGSQHTDITNLHAYDWDEKTHDYVNH
jgi:hypothetical protein